MALDLKPFFLHATYSEEEDREMIKMLWGQCVPKAFFNFIKQPDNFEYLLSQNVSFKESVLLFSAIVYRYAPTMCSIPDFDQKYSLPKITKNPKVNEKKLAAREQKKKMLIEQLNKNTEKMRQIKKCK